MGKGVTIDFNADIAKYTSGIDRAIADLNKFQSNTDRIEKKLMASFRGIKKSLIGVIGTGSFAALAKHSLDTVDAIGKLAEVSGFSTGKVQELTHAFSESGVSLGETESALKKFDKRLGLARKGIGAAAKEYKEFNIDVRQSTEKVFADVVDIIASYEDQADRAALTTKFFGDEAIKLELALRGGNAALSDWAKEARELGLVLSDELVKGAADANDELEIMKKVIDTQITKAFAELSPVIVKTGNAFVWFASNVRKGYEVLNSYVAPEGENQFNLLMEKSLELHEQIIRLEDDGRARNRSSRLMKLREELAGVNKEMDELREKNIQRILNEAGGGGNPPAGGLRGRSGGKGSSKEIQLPTLSLDNRKGVIPYKDPVNDFIDSLFRYREELDLINPKLERLGVLYAEGAIPQEVFIEGVKRLGFETDSTFDSMSEKLEKLNDSWKDLGLTFQSAFEDALVRGESVREMLGAIEEDLKRVLTRNLVTIPLGNKLSGVADNLFSKYFSGGAPVIDLTPRAFGGPVFDGVPYLVGEHGPELFVPRSNGNITPNNQLGGVNINVYVNAPAGANPEAYRLSARQGALEGSRLLGKARGIS